MGKIPNIVPLYALESSSARAVVSLADVRPSASVPAAPEALAAGVFVLTPTVVQEPTSSGTAPPVQSSSEVRGSDGWHGGRGKEVELGPLPSPIRGSFEMRGPKGRFDSPPEKRSRPDGPARLRV